jgi:ribosomal subunit interface protein
MNLRVSGKNMDIGKSLREKAQDYFDAAVSKYFDRGYTGHLTIEPEGHGFKAECVVHLDSGVILKASASAQDATTAYEKMAAHIEKRLRRYKRKLKNHRRIASSEDIAQAYILASPDSHEEEVAEDFAPPIIAEDTSNLTTMSVGEAVMELDLAQSDVIVFRSAGHGGVNVVYRRSDGNIGWVDPAVAKNS